MTLCQPLDSSSLSRLVPPTMDEALPLCSREKDYCLKISSPDLLNSPPPLDTIIPIVLPPKGLFIYYVIQFGGLGSPPPITVIILAAPYVIL